MPKVPVDYSTTCIYKLTHKDDVDNENIYIGSTCNFVNRRYQHKHSCVKENDRHHKEPMYQYIRDNGGWNEWIMVEIEKYPCTDKREAETRERYWIEHYKSTLNKNIPTRTEKERYLANHEILYQKKREYDIKNMSKIKALREQKVTCECGCVLSKYKLRRHQETDKHAKLMSS